MPRLVQPGRHRDGGPGVGGLQVAAPHPLRLVLNWGRRYSLWVFNFGLACCAIEFIAASMARHDFIRLTRWPASTCGARGPARVWRWMSTTPRSRRTCAR